jgi:sulfite exporter TauE/SafE
MCAAPCAAAVGAGSSAGQVAFHGSRIAGYAVGGALASASVSALAEWSAVSPALRPLWTLLNASALLLGLWLLRHGRQPVWLGRFGRQPAASTQPPDGWQVVKLPARAAVAGALWVAWPCGLLQSALLVASLTGATASGAAAMAAFAIASSPGLFAGPWVWRRLRISQSGAVAERWATRGAGLLLAGASAWALFHQLGPQVAAFCSTL